MNDKPREKARPFFRMLAAIVALLALGCGSVGFLLIKLDRMWVVGVFIILFAWLLALEFTVVALRGNGLLILNTNRTRERKT
jgi:hypothetical protein